MTIRPWYTDRSFRTSAEYSLAIAVGRQAVLWSDDPPRMGEVGAVVDHDHRRTETALRQVCREQIRPGDDPVADQGPVAVDDRPRLAARIAPTREGQIPVLASCTALAASGELSQRSGITRLAAVRSTPLNIRRLTARTTGGIRALTASRTLFSGGLEVREMPAEGRQGEVVLRDTSDDPAA